MREHPQKLSILREEGKEPLTAVRTPNGFTRGKKTVAKRPEEASSLPGWPASL